MMKNHWNLLAEWSREHVFQIAAAAAMMATWRFTLGKLSTRYWASVWIPLLLLAAYLLYWKPLGMRLSRMLCLILCLVFLGKDLHLNWNDRCIVDAAAAIRQDAQMHPRAFLAESHGSKTLLQMGFYSGIPEVDCFYWRDFSVLRRSAEGLYDVCYFITLDNAATHQKTLETLKDAGAELIYAHEKDMRGKKQLRVYRFPIAPQKSVLPVTGEIWPNGNFEKVGQLRKFRFPDSYYPISGAALTDEAISGKHAIRFQSPGASFVYTALVPPPEADGTIVFTVKSKHRAKVTFAIWQFGKKGELFSREASVDAVLPDGEITHQFQIPYHAADYARAARIRCYWTISAPYGLILDDFGVYRP